MLGVARVEFLGYGDSGMVDMPTNDAAGIVLDRRRGRCGARRLAAILEEEDAEVVTAYDERGGYGHPDHIQVHRVGRARGRARTHAALLRGDGEPPALPEPDAGAGRRRRPRVPRRATRTTTSTSAWTSRSITTIVDVSSVIDRKRAAMAAHPSQIGEESFFLAFDDDMFLRTWGTEWFIRLDSTPQRTETWLFDELSLSRSFAAGARSALALTC